MTDSPVTRSNHSEVFHKCYVLSNATDGTIIDLLKEVLVSPSSFFTRQLTAVRVVAGPTDLGITAEHSAQFTEDVLSLISELHPELLQRTADYRYPLAFLGIIEILSSPKANAEINRAIYTLVKVYGGIP